MSIEEEVQKILQKAAIDGVLTKTAVDHIESVIKENEALNDSVRKLEKAQEERTSRYYELREEKESLALQVDTWESREASLCDRETQIALLEMNAAHEKRRVEDHINMVRLVFRNSQVRETVIGQEVGFVPGVPEVRDQYGNIVQHPIPNHVEGVPLEKTTTRSED